MALTENQKYEQLLATAKDLFWKYGINRVTIEEICREAEVSKMTFYKHFNNKNDLIRKLIDRIFTDSMHEYNSIMESSIEFHEKVRKMVEMKIKGTNNISKEFLKDFYSRNDPELTEFFQSKIDESIMQIQCDFTTAIERGDIRSNVNPDFILYYLNRIIAMANDPELVRLYDSAQKMILEVTNIFFYGILPVTESKDVRNG